MARIGPTHLLHAAWDVTPGRYWNAPENLDWVAASLHLYRAFQLAGGRRFVGVGTCAEYDWTEGQLEEASTPLRPATLYGKAKHAVHELLAEAALRDGISLAWGRVFFLYGPHEAAGRLVPAVIVPLLGNEPAILGEGKVARDFMHVADVARALVHVLDTGQVGPVNIATGQSRLIREVVEEIAALIGRPDLLRLGARASPAHEPPQLNCGGGLLRSLGFVPDFTLLSGLEDTIRWWRLERHRHDAKSERLRVASI